MAGFVGIRDGNAVYERDDGTSLELPVNAASDLGVDVSTLPDLNAPDQNADATSLGILEAAGLPPLAQGVPPVSQATVQAPPEPPPYQPLVSRIPTPEGPAPTLIPHPPRTGYAGVDVPLEEGLRLREQSVLGQNQGIADQQESLRAYGSKIAELEQATRDTERAALDQEVKKVSAFNRAKSEIQGIQKEISDRASQEPDMGRWWDNRNGYQKAAAYIGVIFHGLARSSNGPNPAIQAIMGEIDKDVANQSQRIDRELKALGEKKSAIGQVLDLDIEKAKAIYAAKTARVATLLKAIDVAASRAKNDQQIAALDQARASLTAALGEDEQKLALQTAPYYWNREELYAKLALERRQAEAKSAAGALEGEKELINDPYTQEPVARVYDVEDRGKVRGALSGAARAGQVVGQMKEIGLRSRAPGEQEKYELSQLYSELLLAQAQASTSATGSNKSDKDMEIIKERIGGNPADAWTLVYGKTKGKLLDSLVSGTEESINFMLNTRAKVDRNYKFKVQPYRPGGAKLLEGRDVSGGAAPPVGRDTVFKQNADGTFSPVQLGPGQGLGYNAQRIAAGEEDLTPSGGRQAPRGLPAPSLPEFGGVKLSTPKVPTATQPYVPIDRDAAVDRVKKLYAGARTREAEMEMVDLIDKYSITREEVGIPEEKAKKK